MSENMQPHYTTVRVPERPRRDGRLVPMVPAVTWQTTPPTAPGWFWVRFASGSTEVVYRRSDGVCERVGTDRTWARLTVEAWSGPLVPPGGEYMPSSTPPPTSD